MNPIEIAWLAGLFEGEGYFGFQSSLRAQILMTDLDVIEKVKLITMCRGAIYNKKPSPGRKQAYALQLSGQQAAELMVAIYPHMGERRRERILAGLRKWRDSPGPGNYKRRDKRYCDRGHVMFGRNIYIKPNGTRRCRTCFRAVFAAWEKRTPSRKKNRSRK